MGTHRLRQLNVGRPLNLGATPLLVCHPLFLGPTPLFLGSTPLFLGPTRHSEWHRVPDTWARLKLRHYRPDGKPFFLPARDDVIVNL